MGSKTFPEITADETNRHTNPAIQLYGNRFFADQTVSELLAELFLLVYSPKRIGDEDIDTFLPPFHMLKSLEKTSLSYAPKARLNLKLFFFLGASNLETRHMTHRDHHENLINKLKDKIQVYHPKQLTETISTLESLFLGFRGIGTGRTWCTQSFLPITLGFLACETIWSETKAKNNNPREWLELLERPRDYFSMTQHLFLARGGELLYLQVCNALRQSPQTISEWSEKGGFALTKNEKNPEWLHAQLNQAFRNLMQSVPQALNELADLIDVGIDPVTAQKTDFNQSDRRYASTGWCKPESWKEGYLFAIDLLRLMRSNMDIIERVYLLESACTMQVLRTLAIRSSEAHQEEPSYKINYRFVVSAPEETDRTIRQLSHHSLKMTEKMIFQSLRSDAVELPKDEQARVKVLKEADSRYGGKNFIRLSKRIGIVVPHRGPGARFVLNEQLLRFLVISTIPDGSRITFDTFKELLTRRHGMVFDAQGFTETNEKLFGKSLYFPGDTDQWLQDMLEAAGFLIHLSDSCALVHNPGEAIGES